MASTVKIAESAWEHVVERSAGEGARRHAAAPPSDDVTARWHSANRLSFLGAWQHVSRMTNPEDLRADYANLLTSPDNSIIRKTLEALSVDVSGLLAVLRSEEGAMQFKSISRAIEATLIACMGHAALRPRALAVRLLNALYDGCDWQIAEPYKPVIKFVHDAFRVDVYTMHGLEGEDATDSSSEAASSALPTFRVLVSAPAFGGASGAAVDHIVTMHVPVVTKEEVLIPLPADAEEGDDLPAHAVPTSVYRVTLDLSAFPRCGFYDWRVVAVSPDGTARPVAALMACDEEEAASHLTGAAVVTAATPRVTAGASAAPATFLASSAVCLAQGRYIVQREGLATEQFRELIVDLDGMKFTPEGQIKKHGTFEDIASRLPLLKAQGVTSVYLLGAIERDNGWGEVDAVAAQSSNGAVVSAGGKAGLTSPSRTNGGVAYPSVVSVNGDSESESDSFGLCLDDSSALAAPAAGGAAKNAFGALLASAGNSLAKLASGAGHLVSNVVTGVTASGASGSASSDTLTNGMREFASRPDANPHAVVDRHTPNRMLGGHVGFSSLVRAAEAHGIRILVQCDANVSASRPHRKYAPLYAHTLNTKGQSVVHAGTDALENQWEDQQLLNYRKLETWELLVSEMKTLVQNYSIGGLYLTDAQSYPFIMALDQGEMYRRDVDGENHYTAQEIMDGEVVLANTEMGFWSTSACATYPNPLFVKLARSVWQIAPSFTFVGECHWGRAASLVRSGLVPHTLDIANAVSATIGRYTDKNGQVGTLSLPHDVTPVLTLRGVVDGESQGYITPMQAPQFAANVVRTGSTYPHPLRQAQDAPAGDMPAGGMSITLRSLSTARMPYPALLLGRHTWTAVDVLYCLPGVPMSFQDEEEGKAFRVDVTGTYSFNERYLEDERKMREKRAQAEKHTLRSRLGPAVAAVIAATRSGSGGGSGAASHGAATASNTFALGAQATSSQSNAPFGDTLADAHLGVGGVMPAMPLRDVPSYKLTRTGFSSSNLVSMGEGGMLLPAESADDAAGGHMEPAVPALPTPTSARPGAPQPAFPPMPSPLSGGGHAAAHLPHGSSGLNPSAMRSSASRMFTVSSSPALQTLLLGSGGDDASSADMSSGSAVSPQNTHLSPSHTTTGGAKAARGAGAGASGDDMDDDADFSTHIRNVASMAASSFGFHMPAFLSGQKSTQPAAGRHGKHGPGSVSSVHTATGSDALSVASSSRPSAVSAARSLTNANRVQSWSALESMTFKGDAPGSNLVDSVRQMTALEARIRAEVGPEYGFDLQQIQGHYRHRRMVRQRYSVFRDGETRVLAARHRFGEHGNVFAFARFVPGQVAVVACNFNSHISTFAVDCSDLTNAFGASTAADASQSVAQLMAASVSLGETALLRLQSAGTDAAAVVGRDRPQLDVAPAIPSLNLRGGVWEVRNVFESSPKLAGQAFRGGEFSDADGPLVGIVSAEEAAYAPMLATLQPHRSYCWLYCAAAGSSGAGAAEDTVAPPAFTVLDRDAETDPAAMRWLFASSLLRLQAVLRLKECGLSSAIITRSDVTSAGSYNAAWAARINRHEPWIAPGEALKDSEIQVAARHNLVYSLLRHVTKRAYRAMTAARAANASSASSELVTEVAVQLEAAFRVLVTHWKLHEARAEVTASTPSAHGEPARLQAEPLPSLHGALNRADAENVSPTSGSSVDHTWFAVDADAAISVCRAALFLAVKDVVAQAASAPSVSDFSDEDAALSGLLVRAMAKVARGTTTAGKLSSTLAGSVASSLPESLMQAEAAVVSFTKRLLWTNRASPMVFVTPELGKWSTVGGLGVMVDELTVGLAELGANVICVSPYYHVNRKGVSDYLRADGITYTGTNISVWVGNERIEMGVHSGVVNGVHLFFLHHPTVFPRPYPSLDAFGQVRVLTAFSKATLELLCQFKLIPSLVITNDWFTGLVPAYARHNHFGDVFNCTDFMHIAHNLNPDYEGRLWPDRTQGTLHFLHGLPSDLLVDPHWSDVVINPTRAALLCSDTWATVSRSYRQDLLTGSPLQALLRLAPHPFAHPNGIPVKARAARLGKLPFNTHESAKAALQRKYFGFESPDLSIPLFAFVGRITMQKGVHLILQAAEEVLRLTDDRVMFLVGGMASTSDTYGNNCAGVMRELHARYPHRFWADPTLFFTDGDLVNLGADFCMMPSMFEPGGIVQQEFFVASTPVIAFKTGGLKDTVFEFDPVTQQGNGFVFEGYDRADFVAACRRAVEAYSSPELYAKLRRNARESVMDLDVVSLAWYREFHRVRRCLPPPAVHRTADVLTKFSFALSHGVGVTPASTLFVTGTFTDWKAHVPLAFNGVDRFEGDVRLAPGLYQFKFIVDGTWITSPAYHTLTDATGHMNNVVDVVAPAEVEDEE